MLKLSNLVPSTVGDDGSLMSEVRSEGQSRIDGEIGCANVYSTQKAAKKAQIRTMNVQTAMRSGGDRFYSKWRRGGGNVLMSYREEDQALVIEGEVGRRCIGKTMPNNMATARRQEGTQCRNPFSSIECLTLPHIQLQLL